MGSITKQFKSVRGKLFFTLCIIVLSIILFLIIVNSFVLEKYYQYAKSNQLKNVYNTINAYYNGEIQVNDMEDELDQISIKNNFDIIIRNVQGTAVYLSNKDFLANVKIIIDFWGANGRQEYQILEETDNLQVRTIKDTETKINYIMLSGKLDNGFQTYIRIPLSSIKESVRISNSFLYTIATIVIIVGGIAIMYISKSFSNPISEINSIAKKMSNLDFSHKYVVTDDDEINELGQSINVMSDKLEATINQLRNTNIELEKDIEKKSKIDEMRKSFISDVSHELKTPIALIQGYSEGLLENVNSDSESRKFYAEVILDETNKMDKMVKQLLELTKLEYEKREFNNTTFNIVELEKEIVRTSQVMLDEKGVKVEFDTEDKIEVFADDMYISQIVTNYLTNAIKHVKEIDGQKYIKITNTVLQDKGKVRVTVFNTGNNISEENLTRVWNRFFKADEARNRDDGGSGIGLSIVRAIMNNYGNDFGVQNKDNGVEFYFDVDLTN
ncbi:MAG: GHKL domain-containing protein [Clostridia bacterium]|nr:GHKL domain-containing protein [Clostridia bacterium]